MAAPRERLRRGFERCRVAVGIRTRYGWRESFTHFYPICPDTFLAEFPQQTVEIAMTISETDFAYRLDRWDTYGGNIIHHIAIIDDLELAMAAYEAACKRWPGEAITLRQGARIIKATPV